MSSQVLFYTPGGWNHSQEGWPAGRCPPSPAGTPAPPPRPLAGGYGSLHQNIEMCWWISLLLYYKDEYNYKIQVCPPHYGPEHFFSFLLYNVYNLKLTRLNNNKNMTRKLLKLQISKNLIFHIATCKLGTGADTKKAIWFYMRNEKHLYLERPQCPGLTPLRASAAAGSPHRSPSAHSAPGSNPGPVQVQSQDEQMNQKSWKTPPTCQQFYTLFQASFGPTLKICWDN